MVELAGVRGEHIGDQWLAGAVPVSNVEGVWKFGCLLHGRVGCCDGVVFFLLKCYCILASLPQTNLAGA